MSGGNIDALFHPHAIAVCGGTGEGKLAAVLIERLTGGGFGRVYAVNPKAMGYKHIQGYHSIADVPDMVDMAVIASPAATVAGVLRDAGEAGVKAAVIISSGFSEAGNAALEAEAMAVAREYGIRCTGPNCAGLINTANSLYPTLEAAPKAGRTAVISQSGAVGGLIMAGGAEVSKFVSYGNGADLNETELISYMAEDDETDVILMYIESIRDGRRFMDALSAAVRRKPVVILKSGRTGSGGRAALSHTGAMAGADAVYGAAFKKCGAVRAYSVEEAVDAARALASCGRITGRRTAVITNSGGPGVMTADRLDELGLDCFAPNEAQKEELRAALPPFAGLNNPIDLTAQGDAAMYGAAVGLALKSCDAVIVIYVGTPYLEALPVAKAVAKAAAGTDKPVLASFDVGADIDAARRTLYEANVPCFSSGERAARALSLTVRGTQGRLDAPVAAQPPIPGRVLEPQAMDILQNMGISVPERAFARTEDEAAAAAVRLGGAVCVKVVSPDIIHKTDAGGVRLNVSGEDAVRSAFRDMAAVGGAGFGGVMVYPMLAPCTEVIMGLTRDAQFGPVAAFGLGGIYAEALGDIELRIAPLSRAEALDMITRSKAYKLLSGARGRPPADMDALAEMLVKLSELMNRYENVREVDLNPVFAGPNGAVAADARIITEEAR